MDGIRLEQALSTHLHGTRHHDKKSANGDGTSIKRNVGQQPTSTPPTPTSMTKEHIIDDKNRNKGSTTNKMIIEEEIKGASKKEKRSWIDELPSSPPTMDF